MTALGPDGAPAEAEVPRSSWLALGVSTLMIFLVVIDISAVNVAFPSIREDFAATDAELSWIISGYSVVVGALLLAAGRIADSVGRRRIFLPGVALFGFGSLLCGFAGSVEILIATRVVQAIGGAITTASGFAVVLPGFPPSKRSTAIGVAGASGAMGAVVGPAVGSLLIEAFDWRAIFLVNVPLCLVILVLGPRLLVESRDPDATGKIDVAGVVIGTLAVGLVMFGIVQSETWGLADWRVWALVIVGAALFPTLVRRSRNHPEPLLDLDLYRYRSFMASNVAVIFYGFAFTSSGLTSSLLLQDLWDQPLTTVGLAFIPGPLLASIASPLTGRLADRAGHRWVLGAGCGLLAVSNVLALLLYSEEATVWSRFLPISLIGGVGVGLTVATWSSAALADIPPAKFGVAGATQNTIRQAAYSLGISMTITLIALGDGGLDGFRYAWIWMTLAFIASGALVMWLFPAGSSSERDALDTARR